jgi:hypothetical protein
MSRSVWQKMNSLPAVFVFSFQNNRVEKAVKLIKHARGERGVLALIKWAGLQMTHLAVFSLLFSSLPN